MLQNITLVFFVYGLAFFCMGLALFLEAGRSPRLAEARVLMPLALFGSIHGIHEWLEMFIDASPSFHIRFPEQIAMGRVLLLALSFTLLVIFGLRMLQPQRNLDRGELLFWGGLLLLYLISTFAIAEATSHGPADRLVHLDVMVRYLLGVVGAALAGAALLHQAQRAGLEGRRAVAIHMRWAAWGFLLYAATQMIVPSLDIFPANLLNNASFQKFTGMPIQVIRAIAAIWITISMLQAIQAAENERQRQVELMQQARLEAMEQVQHELQERENMRQELMRHTVIAQEEERARIARELHDETAQTLTAFSLHLAALREIPSNGADKAKLAALREEQLSRLHTLSRQMSQGIYRLVRDLRPAQLDDLGLVAALQYLADEAFTLSNLHIKIEISGERRRVDSLVETVLFRVSQEAIHNIIRHAGVNQATLQLIFSPEQIRLIIHDQGLGFDPDANQIPPRGWGLAGMRERIFSVGGDLAVQSAPGKGTTIIATIPLLEVSNADHSANTSR